MARDLAANNLTATTSNIIAPVLFAELDFSSGIVRAHSGIGTITWGGYDWLGVGAFGNIDGLEEKSDLSRKTVTFILSGIPNTLLSVILGESYQGRPANIYIGFFSNSTYQLVETPELLFTGKIDSAATEEGDTFAITLTAESRMAAWSRPVIRRYNDIDQQIRFPGDLGLQYITQAVQKEIIWGRKA